MLLLILQGARRFEITDAKLFIAVVTLSTQDNSKCFQQLKPSFERTINWNKYQSTPKNMWTKNQYLNHLVDPCFQGVNRLIVLSFENENGRTAHTEYFLLKEQIKDYNVKIDGKSFFDQPMNKDTKTYQNIRTIVPGHRDDY